MVFYRSITKNKSIEIQFDKFEGSTNIFSFIFNLTHSMDHAGLNISIDIWKYSFHFIIYDNRHWDYDNNRYIN